jgi:hypothetical protein
MSNLDLAGAAVAVRANVGIPVEKADLCIVGAGLAGINALFVASRYLTRD